MDDPSLDLSSLRALIDHSIKDRFKDCESPEKIKIILLDDEDEGDSRHQMDLETAESNPNTPRDNVPRGGTRRRWTYAAEEAARKNSFNGPAKWKKAEIEEETKDPEDEEIDTIIREHENEPAEFWDELTEKMKESKKDFLFDYIVAVEPLLKAEQILEKPRSKVLIKWTEYANPTWDYLSNINKAKGKGAIHNDQVIIMSKRLEIMARLEERLRKETPDFETKYPYRWLPVNDPIEGYVEDERARYTNRLRGWEWRMNFEIKRQFKDGANLYVENWVDDVAVPTPNEMKFIVKNHPSAKVADVLANTNELAWVKCDDCSQSCTYPKEHFEKKSQCCGVLYGSVNHYFAERKVLRTIDPDVNEDGNVPANLTNSEIEMSLIVECTDDCMCEKCCNQRLVQKGRKIPLILFREDPKKGWGVRAGAEISAGDFVAEYVGEVITAGEEDQFHTGSRYSFAMRFGWTENLKATDRVKNRRSGNVIRKHRPFAIESTNMGNEARYINHSCEPNLVSVVVYVERHGEFYHRIAFFARKNIEFGEELTIDYFPDFNVNENDEKDKDARNMFDECRCQTETCKFKDLEFFSDQDADCHSADSFMTDDEKLEETKKEVIRKRKEMDREIERRKKVEVKREEKMKERERGEKEKKTRKRMEDHFESRRFATGKQVTDMRRDPEEIIRERCGGDDKKADEVISSRMDGGILKHFKIPWSAEKQQEMFEKALESKERKKREREETDN